MSELNVATIRAYSLGIGIFEQEAIVKAIYEDMSEFWLTLMTPDKREIIVEEIGTNQKRRLVRSYIVEFIKKVRNTLGLDLCTKVIDSDNVYWIADDIALRIGDSQVESHFSMFRSLFSAIFGLSIRIIDFMFSEEKTREALYAILSDFYNLEVQDVNIDEEINREWFTERFKEALEEPSLSIIEVY